MNPERGTGGGTPLKNHKAIEFLFDTGKDTLEKFKATKPAFNVEPSSARQGNVNGVSLVD